MARTVRDASLETGPRGLKPRGKPYYRSLEEGLHLGYRKGEGGAGKWVCRHYVGGQTYAVETIAAADDLSDADGVVVLSYRRRRPRLASAWWRALMPRGGGPADGQRGR